MFGRKQTYNMIVFSVLVGLLTVNVTLADNIVGNGGFEVEGTGGVTDSAMWNEYAWGPSASSKRAGGSLGQGGAYVHNLYSDTIDPLASSSAGVSQNTIADAGGVSLQPGDYLAATFNAEIHAEYFGVFNAYLAILNSVGGLVDDTAISLYSHFDTIHIPNSNFLIGHLQVPEFGPAPADTYSAVFSIGVSSTTYIEGIPSIAWAYIDNVIIYTGTDLIPEPSSLALFGGTGMMLFRRGRVNRTL